MMNAIDKGMYVISGDSIADLEAGLAELKRQVAAGVKWGVCYGEAPKIETKKEKDDDCCDEDCNNCPYDTDDGDEEDWDVCWGCDKEDCHDCDIFDDKEEDEEESTVDNELIKAILDLAKKFKAD